MFMTSLLLDIRRFSIKKKGLYLPVINYLQLFSSDVFTLSPKLVLSKTTAPNYMITEVLLLSSSICCSGAGDQNVQAFWLIKTSVHFWSFSFINNCITSVVYWLLDILHAMPHLNKEVNLLQPVISAQSKHTAIATTEPTFVLRIQNTSLSQYSEVV